MTFQEKALDHAFTPTLHLPSLQSTYTPHPFILPPHIVGMLAILEPLHQMMDAAPMTFQEKAFDHAYGRELREAQAWCHKYRQQRSLLTARAAMTSGVNTSSSNTSSACNTAAAAAANTSSSTSTSSSASHTNTKELTQAWDIYYHVFRRITKQLPLVSLGRLLCDTITQPM